MHRFSFLRTADRAYSNCEKRYSKFSLFNFYHFIIGIIGIDFRTARQVKYNLKEPRRLKKDALAQTSIDTFFTKKDTANSNNVASMVRVKQEPGTDEATNRTGSAHNGQSHAGGRMQIKNEKISDDEVSDAETEKNFELDSPRRIKEEPMDATEMLHIVVKTDPEEMQSDEDTDVEDAMDSNLQNEFDSSKKIKTEPSYSYDSIMKLAKESDAKREASLAKEKSVDLPIAESDESKEDNEVDPSAAGSRPTAKFDTDPGARSVDFIMKDADSRNEILVTTKLSESSQPFAKRKPDHQLGENRTKKQRVHDMSSRETNFPSTSAAALNRADAKYDEVMSDDSASTATFNTSLLNLIKSLLHYSHK